VPVRRIRAENNLNGDKIVVGRVLRITAARDICDTGFQQHGLSGRV